MQIRIQGWKPVCLAMMCIFPGSCSDSNTGKNNQQSQVPGAQSSQQSASLPRDKATSALPQIVKLQNESIKRLGIVEFSSRTVIYKDNPLVSTQASGHFIEYEAPLGPLALSELEDAFNPDRNDCTITVDDWTNSNVELFPEGRYISVGEVLSITAPEGSWPELTEHEGLPGFYEMGEDQWLNKPVPGGTRLDIPGGDFEPYSVALESIAPMEGVRISNNTEKSLSQSNLVYWNKGLEPDTTIVVTLDYAAEDQSKEVYVRCVTNDTGSYTFPPQVQEVIRQFDMQSTDLVVSRHTWQYLVKGDALLIVTNTAKSIKW